MIKRVTGKHIIVLSFVVVASITIPILTIFDNVGSSAPISNSGVKSLETDSIQPSGLMPYSLRVGQELYNNYCQICHGETGEGDGFNAYMLSTKPRNFSNGEYMNTLSDERIAETIQEGGRGVNKSVLMPAWGNTFDPLEITFLVRYIRTLW